VDGAVPRARVPQLLAAARAEGEYVVVDTGPLLESATATHLCAGADAVVLVLGPRQRPEGLRRALLHLRGVPAPVLPVRVELRRRRRRDRTKPVRQAPVTTAEAREPEPAGAARR
jgi:hypothetical protein